MNGGIIHLYNEPRIISSACVVGNEEHIGPLGDLFDGYSSDSRFGMKTWESAESEMQRRAFLYALKKGSVKCEDISAVFAGDLQNQCVASTYGLLPYNAPYIGLYGACSTLAEGLVLSSMLIDSKKLCTVAVSASSHFCAAERQFRFPLEYGSQRPPTAQRTVTAAGTFILSQSGADIRICDVLIGRICDSGISDISNMGAAMAPAAADTLCRYFAQSQKRPSDFDLILTGDLGYEGIKILKDLCFAKGLDLSGNLNDCGLLIYSASEQDVHAGGSGCGCSAAVMSGYIMKRLKDKTLKNILLMCTGAMMSPTSLLQGQRIPSIAHLVHIRG